MKVNQIAKSNNLNVEGLTTAALTFGIGIGELKAFIQAFFNKI